MNLKKLAEQTFLLWVQISCIMVKKKKKKVMFVIRIVLWLRGKESVQETQV